MSSPISPIRAVPLPDLGGTGAGGPAGGARDFQSLLANAIGGVERLRGDAGKSVERFMAGDGEEVHTVALATQRAELAFETFLQIRNKVVSAYQAVMQMQV
ncbi:MAG: flagellar hook-basal body complex protein FliE [Bryobacteraceae bacterium]|jgi:flagellar hook-basal body complex protein FliE